MIGLIENSTANLPNTDMPGMSNEPNPEAPKLTPAATEGITSAAGTISGRTEGLRDPAVRVVPFQPMPQSTQEELGKELFDDPLLSVDNVIKEARRLYAVELQIYQGKPSFDDVACTE